MRTRELLRVTPFLLLVTMFQSPAPAVTRPAQPASAAASEAKPFLIEGRYVEACTCNTTCRAEISGESPGCDAAAVYQFDKGMYDGKDFSGCRLVCEVDHGDQVHLYLDAPDSARLAALEAFARAAFAAWGSIKDVSRDRIELAGKDGAYTAKVDGGRIMTLSTEPVLGGDHTSPVKIENSQNTLSPTILQGRCLSCTYADGDHKINIPKGGNSFFNEHITTHGKI